MRHRSRYVDSNEELNIWSAFTDLMSNAFMIAILFLLLMIVKSVVAKSILDKNLNSLGNRKDQVGALARQVKVLQAKANRSDELEHQVAVLQKQLKSGQRETGAPPIIVIEDEEAYRFASGSAEIPPSMKTYIKNKIVPEIERNTQQYQINVVELIGHTDGQANGSAASNLDLNLEKVAIAQNPVSNLHSGSNADLGLMRALAVVRLLRDIQTKNGRLKGLKFRAYSAAQLILPSGEFASIRRHPDATRRRIEIRFTRLGEVTRVR